MLLKSLFRLSAPNRKAYRAQLERRKRLYCFLVPVGALTALFSRCVRMVAPHCPNPDFFEGMYCGAGIAIMLAAAIALRKVRALLADEAAMQRQFVVETDERSRSVTVAAFAAAALALCVLLYVGILFVGLFYPVLFVFCLVTVVLFFALFLGFHCYYDRTM